MWNVDQIKAVHRELNMTSSERGHPSVTAIENTGTRLFNALEFFEFQKEACQVDICEECGIPHCQPGGWVSFRRLGDRVMWIPAVSLMKGEMGNEFRPPEFLSSKGAPMFALTVWEEMRRLHKKLPRAADLLILNSREFVCLLQQSAPGRVLGKFPERALLRRELIAAAKNGDETKQADQVDASLKEWSSREMPLSIVADSSKSIPITLWLNLPGTPEWTCAWQTSEGASQMGEGTLVLEPSPEVREDE
jgi:hypothetical protein